MFGFHARIRRRRLACVGVRASPLRRRFGFVSWGPSNKSREREEEECVCCWRLRLQRENEEPDCTSLPSEEEEEAIGGDILVATRLRSSSGGEPDGRGVAAAPSPSKQRAIASRRIYERTTSTCFNPLSTPLTASPPLGLGDSCSSARPERKNDARPPAPIAPHPSHRSTFKAVHRVRLAQQTAPWESRCVKERRWGAFSLACFSRRRPLVQRRPAPLAAQKPKTLTSR